MSSALERQRWLGALALAVAVPLPFTGIVSLPFLLPFGAAALAALFARRPLAPLRPWVENLLAPAILVAVVAAGGLRFGILRPVAQLAVLLAAVRLPGSGYPARTLRTGALVALIGVAGIASTTHPVLALYLVAAAGDRRRRRRADRDPRSRGRADRRTCGGASARPAHRRDRGSRRRGGGAAVRAVAPIALAVRRRAVRLPARERFPRGDGAAPARHR